MLKKAFRNIQFHRMFFSFSRDYFSDRWNILDWVVYLCLLVVTILHLTDIFIDSNLREEMCNRPTLTCDIVLGKNTDATNREIYTNGTTASKTGNCISDWYNRIFALTLIVLWIRLYKYIRPFRTLGPFIVIMTKVLKDVGLFLCIYSVVFIPTVLALWIMFGEDNIQNLDTIFRLIFTTFRLILVDEYPLDDMVERDEGMTYILVGFHFLMSSIIAINLMIALLSDSFQRVYDNAQAVAIYSQAQAIQDLENYGMTSQEKFEFIDKLSKSLVDGGLGNPIEEDYDDDGDFEDEDKFGETKKASVKAVELLSDIREKMGFDTDVESDGDSDVHYFGGHPRGGHRRGRHDKNIQNSNQEKKFKEIHTQLNLLTMQVNTIDNHMKDLLAAVKNIQK